MMSKLCNNISIIILITIVTGGCQYIPNLEKKDQKTAVKSSSSTYISGYHVRNPQSLDELPEVIQKKVVAYIAMRVGEEFCRTLKFSGGQVVDKPKLTPDNPEAKNNQIKKFTYELEFMFSLPEKGIEAYHTNIMLDEAGEIIGDIDLPHMASDPMKRRFISIQEAKKIAAQNGFKVAYTDIELNYRPQDDAIAWIFSQLIQDDGLIMIYKVIEISAHTSKVLSIHKIEAIR